MTFRMFVMAVFLATPLTAQDLSGLREMETVCLLETTHARYNDVRCKAFRYGIAYRDRQLTGTLGQSSSTTGQEFLRADPTRSFGQLLGKSEPDLRVFVPRSNVPSRSQGQIVR